MAYNVISYSSEGLLRQRYALTGAGTKSYVGIKCLRATQHPQSMAIRFWINQAGCPLILAYHLNGLVYQFLKLGLKYRTIEGIFY